MPDSEKQFLRARLTAIEGKPGWKQSVKRIKARIAALDEAADAMGDRMSGADAYFAAAQKSTLDAFNLKASEIEKATADLPPVAKQDFPCSEAPQRQASQQPRQSDNPR